MVDWSLTGRDPNFGEEGRAASVLGTHRQQINGGRAGQIQGFSSTSLHHVDSLRGGKGVAPMRCEVRLRHEGGRRTRSCCQRTFLSIPITDHCSEPHQQPHITLEVNKMCLASKKNVPCLGSKLNNALSSLQLEVFTEL